MAHYLSYGEKIVTAFDDVSIEKLYNQGYVFTRIGKGVMQQTRSARIDLEKFEPSSENRRILKKTEHLTFTKAPIPYADYSWQIGKMAKDFYETRGATFSANKIKELLTDAQKSNFTTLFIFHNKEVTGSVNHSAAAIGYCIAFETEDIIHYSYPFYESDSRDTGLGMILKIITAVKAENKKYIYLGSLQRETDTYKLQFAGFEWFDGKEWSDDVKAAKDVLATL